MALPRAQDSYDDYTDQLVYFSARLAGNPLVESLAPAIEILIEEVDADHDVLRAARRAEVRARAKRDHRDGVSDEDVKKLRRRLSVVGPQHFVIKRLFPKGVEHVVAPRSRQQIERIDGLLSAIDEVLTSPQLAADPDADELRRILESSRETILDAQDALRTAMELWESAQATVVRARDTLNFRRAEGVNRAGAVLGELRSLLGGSASAAQAYTQPGRKSTTAEAEPETEAKAESETEPSPEPTP